MTKTQFLDYIHTVAESYDAHYSRGDNYSTGVIYNKGFPGSYELSMYSGPNYILGSSIDQALIRLGDFITIPSDIVYPMNKEQIYEVYDDYYEI